MCSVKPQNDLLHKGRAVEEWADLHFFRPIGIRIARALQPTGISADQVTLWSLAIGLVAGHLFAYQDRWTNMIGFLLFMTLYFHLIYRLIHAGFWWPGAFLLGMAAGLAHTYQAAAVDFVRNAFLYIGIGNKGELDLPEDLDVARPGGGFERFGARVYRDYVVRQA